MVAVVVELAQTTRRVGCSSGREYEYVWGFDRESIPPSLAEHGVPHELWRSTCDRFVTTHGDIEQRRQTIAYRRVRTNLLPMIPVLIFTIVFVHRVARTTMYTTTMTSPVEKEGKFLWLAWLITDAAIAVGVLVTWLLTRYCVSPGYLSLEDEWKVFANTLQCDFNPYGVHVGVKRVPAVLGFMVQLLPDGLVSCGLALESHHKPHRSPEVVETERLRPAPLAVAGVPIDTWADTVQQCQVMQECQAARIQAAFRSVTRRSQWGYYFAAACFVAMPVLAWALDDTANYQMSYLGYGFIVFVNVQALVEIMHNKYCCNKVRVAFDQCRVEWTALAQQIAPVYAKYNVEVSVQHRDVMPIPSKFKEIKTTITETYGIKERAVGLSFHSNVDGGAVVSIEYGKIEQADQDDLMNAKALSPLIDSSIV
jgi:hypothetical protein